MKSLNEYAIENNLEENILNRLYFHTNLKEVTFDISLLDKENYWENIL